MRKYNGRIWVISDTHFNHKNIIKYCNRPFYNIEEMNEEIIHRWNSVVKKDDMVFFLGDFCLSWKGDEVIDIGNALNGRKILLKGNHDKLRDWIYYKAGFEKVYDFPFLYNGILFSHEPIPNTKYFNVHGHIHNKELSEEHGFEKSNKHMYFNASADVIDFTPYLLSKIKIEF